MKNEDRHGRPDLHFPIAANPAILLGKLTEDVSTRPNFPFQQPPLLGNYSERERPPVKSVMA